MPDPDLTPTVDAVRRFSRFYTRRIGLLHEGYLDSPYGLTEARVLYELAHHAPTTASALAADLGLDAGYLSRLLRRFDRQGLIAKTPSSADRRQQILQLTPVGERAFAPLEQRSRDDIARLLGTAPPAARQRLVDAMRTIETTLDPASGPSASYLIRDHRPGDMGWVAMRHGALYAAEYGWDATFEALVARIVADFIDQYDAAREHCWIAERDGVAIGSIFLVRHPEREGVAKLRLLLVEPSARGLGVGRRLVEECIRFARQAGYHTITLWTNDILAAARRIYEQAGFRLVHQAPHHAFGHDLVEQTWDLPL